MPVSAANHYSLVLDNAATLFANSSTFQTLMGVGSAAAAKALIYWCETDETVSAESTLPRAIVDFRERQARTNKEGTTTFTGTGPVVLRIEYATAQTTRQDAIKDCLNKAGAIQEEVLALTTGGGQYLNAVEIDLDGFGRLSMPENNANNAYLIMFVVSWVGMHT